MIVTANRTCVLLASEDMIAQRIDAHLARAERAIVSVASILGMGAPKLLQKKAKRPVGNELQTFAEKVPTENQEGSS